MAQRAYTGAVFLAGYPRIREIYDGYRTAYRTAHGQEAPLDRLAYAALVYVGEMRSRPVRGRKKCCGT